MELGKNKTSKREILDPDNPTPEMFYHCQTHYKKVLNPIVDWTTDEVWEFIKEYNVRYCCLYDEGFERLGCIGCPMATIAERKREFARYPKYKENYIRAFEKMLENNRGGSRTESMPSRGSIHGSTSDHSEMGNGQTSNGMVVGESSLEYTIDSTAEEVFKWWMSK